MKLQTFLAHAGITSRRKAEDLIRDGRVKVNGHVAEIGERVDEAKDEVLFDEKRVTAAETKMTYLIYKPVGVLSTTDDELGRKNVVDFLRSNLPAKTVLPRLYPVGRLDKDSEGLMLLTNDGELTQKMTHPSYEVEKTYRVTVTSHPTEKALAHLERGVRLEEGTTAPAKVEVIDESPDETKLEITIHEGRYHQVKRMLRRVGYEVVQLVRIKMGEYTLENLDGAKYTLLSAADSLAKNK